MAEEESLGRKAQNSATEHRNAVFVLRGSGKNLRVGKGGEVLT
jgi:hypothetical protein